MDRVTRWIGAFVLAIVLIGIPIVTTVSFFCGWPGFIKWVGTLITVFEMLWIWNVILNKSEE
jgi:hypothetical protein